MQQQQQLEKETLHKKRQPIKQEPSVTTSLPNFLEYTQNTYDWKRIFFFKIHFHLFGFLLLHYLKPKEYEETVK